ncbi:hypothetical protein WCD74_29735 [Actinomycetospora sp. OC33-EN08]|uniref:DUF998 domain-containing protein n=1 Tax=Actinomycetospora aurantiaca TaxID=3129233 RepID=A0ABU8MZY3_9PSEU
MADVAAHRPPVVVRVLAIAGVALAGAALGVGVFVLAWSAGLRPWRYPGLSPVVSVSYAVVGVLGGALAWWLVRRRARHPRTVLRWSVGAVVGVSLGADVVAGADGRWLVGLLAAAGHLAVVVLAVAVLAWAMPVATDDGPRASRVGWADGLGRGPRLLLALGLVVVAAVWVAVNKAVEGPTLLVITSRHGLTVADLLSVAALVTAGHLVRPRSAVAVA